MTFTYDDIVTIRKDAPPKFRPGEKAWIVGVFTDRDRYKFEEFPPGTVYMIEFEGGDAVDVHDSLLEPFDCA